MQGYPARSSTRVRRLASGVGFSEGPVVTPEDEIYVTSISFGKLYLVDAEGAHVFADTGGGANGAVLDRDGSFYVAQNGRRFARKGPVWPPESVGGIQRVTRDGTVSWVTRDPIAPNDLCFGPDGLIYATDPTRAPGSSDARLWRVDPKGGGTELLCSVRWFANGIAFGPDDRLYVAATDTARIHRFDVAQGGLEGETVVIEMEEGHPDGMAFDAEGNLVIGAIVDEGGAGTIQTWSLDGKLLDQLSPGRSAAYTNIAFTQAGDLVITDSSAGEVLLAEGWPVKGLPLHPFR